MPEQKTKLIMTVARTDEDLLMSVHGDERHSYFVGMVSHIIHQLQKDKQGDLQWEQLSNSKISISAH